MGGRRSVGFTLFELVVVLVVLGTVVLIAVPRQVGSLERRREALVERQLLALHAAGSRLARTTDLDVSLAFDKGSSTVTLEATPADAAADHDLPRVLRLGDAPFSARLAAIDPSGATTIRFDRWGRPDAGPVVAFTVGSRTLKVDLPD